MHYHLCTALQLTGLYNVSLNVMAGSAVAETALGSSLKMQTPGVPARLLNQKVCILTRSQVMSVHLTIWEVLVYKTGLV